MIILVFLHGLLGDKSDWKHIVAKLSPIPCVCVDLPFHGDAQNITVSNFEETVCYISKQIQNKLSQKPYIIVGYSLGGRIALYYALQSLLPKGQLKGIVLEGANLGLTSQIEKLQRWENDMYWANRFAKDNLYSVLNDWYQQSVFSHLDMEQRENIIKKRTALLNKSGGKSISLMLKATSLAKQPNFIEKVRSTLLPIYYIVGEKDHKFKNIAINNQLNHYIVEQSGHNTHQENPSKFVEILNIILKDFEMNKKE
ncbi:2-succinyl-6-hydroxy-2,4-cyclohexadiene-1-carboxylate synthase [Bisgaardia hudsonensis]|uniref:Putative 2-succinyl-6-hydroxy-2,4-cyclohexadiene-1-carboxylate synthase n=1 Tax=Bisgaardia hudsonensis TaxID=109472 RepID=A0A4R2MSI3_9PAST|nr:2-succinyl-6-hydroxy-2,4-cyclohexadiene-1-carboxylate synthase [Bisgaardia hudsonensis]